MHTTHVSEGSEQIATTKSATILIIDANTHNSSLLKRRLAMFGYDVVTVSTAKEGATVMKEKCIDVVFLALDLPVISGFQMLRSIKKRDEFKHIPIIMTSENDDMEKVVKCIESGAEDYLSYPLNHTILKARLLNCIHKKISHDKEVAYISQIEINQKQISAQEKMVSIGTLATSISQELKNPLNFVINFAEASSISCMKCLQNIANDQEQTNTQQKNIIVENIHDIQEQIDKIIEYGKSADQIVRFILDQSSTSIVGMNLGHINRVIEETLRKIELKYKAISCDIMHMIHTSLDDTIEHIPIVVTDLSRMFENIICNAIEAIQKRQLTEPEHIGALNIISHNEEDFVRIVFLDNGCGMNQEVQKHMFDPFFTTKNTNSANNSIGLGLSSVKRIIITEHKGEIHISSEENKYTKFEIAISKHNQLEHNLEEEDDENERQNI